MSASKMGLRGEATNNWKGGCRLSSHGYVIIRIYGSYPFGVQDVYEHRYVMEKHIGRLLHTSEVVHHIDGDRENNHIDNLMLFPSVRAHLSFHKQKGAVK